MAGHHAVSSAGRRVQDAGEHDRQRSEHPGHARRIRSHPGRTPAGARRPLARRVVDGRGRDVAAPVADAADRPAQAAQVLRHLGGQPCWVVSLSTTTGACTTRRCGRPGRGRAASGSAEASASRRRCRRGPSRRRRGRRRRRHDRRTRGRRSRRAPGTAPAPVALSPGPCRSSRPADTDGDHDDGAEQRGQHVPHRAATAAVRAGDPAGAAASSAAPRAPARDRRRVHRLPRTATPGSTYGEVVGNVSSGVRYGLCGAIGGGAGRRGRGLPGQQRLGVVAAGSGRSGQRRDRPAGGPQLGGAGVAVRRGTRRSAATPVRRRNRGGGRTGPAGGRRAAGAAA